MGELVTAVTLGYDVAANYKVITENFNECYHCGPVHPELSRLVPAFAGGGADLDWDEGIPHRDGAWTFTLSGTTTRAPLPGLDEAERTRHKGELVHPNLMLSCSADHVAGVRAATAGGGPDPGRLRPAVRPRTRRRRPASTPPTPPSSGTWSTGRTGPSASPCSAACRRAATPTAGSRRWRTTARTSGAGCCPGWRSRRMADSFEYVVVGLGALGSAAAHQLARRGHRVVGLERFELGHRRGASHDTSRILRHSYHTPEYVRLTFDAYDDWARLEEDSGRVAGDRRRRARPVPARRGDPAGRLRGQPGRGGRPARAARRDGGSRPGGRSSSFPGARSGSTRSAAAIVPAGRGDRGDAAPGGARRRGAARPQPGQRAPRLGDRGVEVVTEDRTYRCRSVVVCADAWTNALLARSAARVPLTVTLEQATYFAPDEPGGLRAGPAAAVDLDGRAVVLRLPPATASRP